MNAPETTTAATCARAVSRAAAGAVGVDGRHGTSRMRRSVRSAVRRGEVVFNTAMTGYQEILTDPSYAGQIVTLTYPSHRQRRRQCGRRGIDACRSQPASSIRDLPRLASSWRRERESCRSYLRNANVVGIADIDTRQADAHPARARCAERLHRRRRPAVARRTPMRPGPCARRSPRMAGHGSREGRVVHGGL